MKKKPQFAFDDISKMFEILFLDTYTLGFEAQKENSPILKRSVARASFAFIEGIIYQVKKKALEQYKSNKEIFSIGEFSLLNEISFEIDDAGKVKERQKFISTIPNIKFTFTAFAKAFACDFTIDYGKKGWACLDKAYKIRNRLMHPKNINELQISKEDLKTIAYASNWFVSVYSKLQLSVIQSYYKKLGKENEGKTVALEFSDSLKKIIPWIERIE